MKHCINRRHCVVVEDRSVAPVWPRWMAARQRSAGGRWWSWRSWSIQRLRGRPELWTQSRSGRLPSDVSTCSLNAWWAGMLLGDILAILTVLKFLTSTPNVHSQASKFTSSVLLSCSDSLDKNKTKKLMPINLRQNSSYITHEHQLKTYLFQISLSSSVYCISLRTI